MRRRVGRLIVVGGHSRGVGKTALVEQLLRTWRGGPVVAVKVSAHGHAHHDRRSPAIEETFDPGAQEQAGRYLAAGAWRAWLCRCPGARTPEAAWFVQALRARGWDVIVESNRIVTDVRPDVVLFVASAATGDWKASSRACLPRADALVLSAGTDTVPWAAARFGWTARGGRAVLKFDRAWAIPGLDRWLAARLGHRPSCRNDRPSQAREVSAPPPPPARRDRESEIRPWPCESRSPSPIGS